MEQSTTTMTLTGFLLARIAEDEALARAAQYVVSDNITPHHVPRWWVKEEHGRVYAGPWLRVVDGGAPAGHRPFANTDALPHVARHDPARVLDECEAKRRIMELHPAPDYIGTPGARLACDRCSDLGGPYGFDDEENWVDWPCPTLRTLALPYANHPDYREEW